LEFSPSFGVPRRAVSPKYFWIGLVCPEQDFVVRLLRVVSSDRTFDGAAHIFSVIGVITFIIV
jgi:hypothetical protein